MRLSPLAQQCHQGSVSVRLPLFPLALGSAAQAGSRWALRWLTKLPELCASCIMPTRKQSGFILALPARDPRVTPLGHMANLEPVVVKEPRTLMESVSLESPGPPSRILGTNGRRKWTMDAGKASKK